MKTRRTNSSTEQMGTMTHLEEAVVATMNMMISNGQIRRPSNRKNQKHQMTSKMMILTRTRRMRLQHQMPNQGAILGEAMIPKRRSLRMMVLETVSTTRMTLATQARPRRSPLQHREAVRVAQRISSRMANIIVKMVTTMSSKRMVGDDRFRLE